MIFGFCATAIQFDKIKQVNKIERMITSDAWLFGYFNKAVENKGMDALMSSQIKILVEFSPSRYPIVCCK